MVSEHNTYREAFNAAVKLARQIGYETGLLGVDCPLARREVFRVYILPRPEYRQGFELRCQVVRPDEPLMSESGA